MLKLCLWTVQAVKIEEPGAYAAPKGCTWGRSR
jgi:hypothetical protein